MKGVPQERVYQVRAQPRGRPAQVGTSTRISNEVLITAAHVVFDTDSGLPAKDITVESLHGGSRHSARVIWPPRFMDKDLDNGPDVALLQFAHRPNIAKPRGFANLGFGRITGQQAGIQFELIAFPHSRIEDGYRDTLHLDGVINPGSALRRRVFELTPNASYRIQDPLWAGPSDWAGASGAAIFCNGLITAILIEDSPQTPEAPLRAFPVEPLFRSSRFCEVLLQLGISPILKSVELCDLLQTNQDAALRFADEETILPSRLLRPDFEAVSFFGRSDTMQSMRDWCNSAADFDYRLLVGSGGRGCNLCATGATAPRTSIIVYSSALAGEVKRAWLNG